MKARKTTIRRRPARKAVRKAVRRKKNGVVSAVLAGAAGAAGTHVYHKVKQWAKGRKAAKSKAQSKVQRTAAKTAKPAASKPAGSAVIGEVASALRNLGYKAPQAKQMAQRAQGQTGSVSFETVFKSAMAGAKKNPRGRKRERIGPNMTAAQRLGLARVLGLSPSPKDQSEKARKARAMGKALGLRKKNSAQASARARRAYKKFTGAKSKRTLVRRTKARLPGNDFAKLGDLVSLTVGNRRVSFESDKTQPIVVTDAKAKRLFFLGGNQDLRMLPPVRKANPGGMHDMGEVEQIEYYSRKKFDDFRPTVYFHNLGEDNGKKPRLMWDPKAKQMYLVGGDYKIRDVGIVN